MVKITADIDRRRTVLTCALGGQFPTVHGRLLTLEASGRELAAFLELHQVPIVPAQGMSVTWSGRGIGHALRRMRELFVSSAGACSSRT
jgi:hypothetical protein